MPTIACAELVASELATNCVVHAGTDFQVFAAGDDGAGEVVVLDRAGWARPLVDDVPTS